MKRVGIVGAGMIANWHAERWQHLPVEIAAHYDHKPEAAAQAAERFGGEAVTSLEALLERVDIVDVCTPTPAHKEAVLAAAAAGKAIICEKPMARHLADAEAMLQACEQAGVPLFIAHVVRFFPQYAQAKALCDQGALGNPGVLRTVRGGSFPRPNAQSWYSDFASSGGVVMDLSIHDLDFARWCFGDVTRVFARGLTFQQQPMRDHVSIVLSFANGAIGHIEGSWAYPPGQFVTSLELAGSEGLLEWDGLDPAPLQGSLRSRSDLTDVSNSASSPLVPEDDPYYQELAHALACFEQGSPMRVTPQDGVMALKLALAVIASLRSGQPVELADFQEEVAL